eukprot:COSAG02_NODE_65952_length_256_cov_1.681529_2_plen_30_part_01
MHVYDTRWHARARAPPREAAGHCIYDNSFS